MLFKYIICNFTDCSFALRLEIQDRFSNFCIHLSFTPILEKKSSKMIKSYFRTAFEKKKL